MPTRRATLLDSIVATISDYREGEIERPTSAHVNKWVQQFPATNQETLLAELDHVLKKTYISRKTAEHFIQELVRHKALAGADPAAYWRRVNVLRIQLGGKSQSDMLDLFADILQRELGIDLYSCGEDGGPYMYLDDVSFSGNRLKNDLIEWLQGEAPAESNVGVVLIVKHTGGYLYARDAIERAAKKAGKTLTLSSWRVTEYEERKWYTGVADVLRPTALPDDPDVQKYAAYLKDGGYPPVLRRGENLGAAKLFSSHEGRVLLEQEFLRAGAKVRILCPNLKENHRPLGYSVLKMLGFGALVVTYRNCPNSCPLALWADDPWYPLFPRKSN